MYNKVKRYIKKRYIAHMTFIKLINLTRSEKATPYEPINDRSFTFENQADVDTYIRMNNQCDFIITRKVQNQREEDISKSLKKSKQNLLTK
jgi:hypothetical protein